MSKKIDDKLWKNRFKVDKGNPHLKIDEIKCDECEKKPCLYACPVENFIVSDDGDVLVSWEGCLECGTCRICCLRIGNKGLSWNYPRGGFGINYSN
jgi:ferredoxin like protein